jgi:hypothetical protein
MISVRVDVGAALAGLTEAELKHVPFAISRGLNRLANDAQADMQAGLKARFHLRREQWNLRGIKIAKEDRSNKTTWRVIIQVSPQTSYLDKFEDGGEKVPSAGRNWIWEPNAKIFKNRVIPGGDPLRPKNLHMHRDGHGRLIGDSRTFIALRASGPYEGFVVQRQNAPRRGFTAGSMKGLNLNNVAVGYGPQRRGMKSLKEKKRKDATVVLYKLRKRVPIKAQLQFEPTIERTVQSRFHSRMSDSLAEALRTAR